MFVDFRESEAPEEFDCDLCVVGAGAAGISMALRLSGSGMRVCLIESGSFEFEAETQALYDGEVVGRQLADPRACRLRYFGGTTNHWAGFCAPMEESDFKVREWVPYSGWPIEKSDLDPYYADAQPILELTDYQYEASERPAGDHYVPPIDQEKFLVRYFQYSPPTRFGPRYREELSQSSNVQVVLNANLTEIRTNDSGSEVSSLRIENLTGKVGQVRARAYVLACGGMENPRLLLLTRDAQPEGLGNAAGMVGRFFQQHPELYVARIVTEDTQALNRAFRFLEIPPVSKRVHITNSPSSERQSELLNIAFEIHGNTDFSSGYKTLRQTALDLRDGKWPDDLVDRVWTVLSDFDKVAKDLYTEGTDRVSELRVYARAEQVPNPDSRISLSDQLDPFGLQRLKVDWQLTPFDKRSIFQSTIQFGAELARLQLCRMKIEDWLLTEDDYWPEPVWSGCHHVGTTRMSADPADGVVDRNCRVHSVNNLYIAGSSVFPTGGYLPPTHTIVALALRLADHIKEEYA